MEFFLLFCIGGLGFIMISFLPLVIRQVNQYERGVLFMLGRYQRTLEPGIHVVVPIIQRMMKVDIRTKTVDLQDQEAITKDNVSTRISAVLYYKISEASKSIIEVEDYAWASSQLAETTMRTIVGEFDLDELLAHRDKVASKIEQIVEKTTAAWGVEVQAVELKDVILPENMKRTIAKQAEAEREKRATIINSEGEMIAAKNLSKAAETMANHPGALHLRTLNSINDISSDQSNTVVFAVPLEALRALEGIGKTLGGGKK
ncbi:slipin family protein [Candidatus Dojkabacteria bacterium]|nr:slipin family protein [Candidatus Dojkabacteria bacterium]